MSDDFTDQILVRSDSWLGHQGAKTKNTKSAVTPELMARSSQNFYHNIWIFDLKVTEVKLCPHQCPFGGHVL
jgi:hypothetical protein